MWRGQFLVEDISDVLFRFSNAIMIILECLYSSIPQAYLHQSEDFGEFSIDLFPPTGRRSDCKWCVLLGIRSSYANQVGFILDVLLPALSVGIKYCIITFCGQISYFQCGSHLRPGQNVHFILHLWLIGQLQV